MSAGDNVMAGAGGRFGSTSVRRERQRRIRPLPSGVLQVQVSHRNSLMHVHNRAEFTADVTWECDADYRAVGVSYASPDAFVLNARKVVNAAPEASSENYRLPPCGFQE